RGRRGGRARRVPGGDGEGVRVVEGGRVGHGGRAGGVLQGTHGRLQVPPRGGGAGRAAQDGQRQDPAPRAAGLNLFGAGGLRTRRVLVRSRPGDQAQVGRRFSWRAATPSLKSGSRSMRASSSSDSVADSVTVRSKSAHS